MNLQFVTKMVTFTYYTFKSFATKNLLVRIEGYIDYDKFISSIINKLQNRNDDQENSLFI